MRWRLWAAWLTLALVPTVAALYLGISMLGAPPAKLGAEHARETSESAAALLSREQAIETRLLVAATDPELTRLLDGVDGSAEREAAARALRTVRGADGSIVVGACLMPSSGRRVVPLTSGGSDVVTCADADLRRLAIGAEAGTVARSTSDAGGSRLMLAVPVRSANGRTRGVLSAEVDVAALFGRTRMLGGSAVTSMLVDMGASVVIATRPATAGPADGVPATDAAVVRLFVPALIRRHDQADEQLQEMGLVPTVVPLWQNGDGSSMGLVQFWPVVPGEWPSNARLALLALMAGAIVAVIMNVRYFLRPFKEMSESRTELQALYHAAKQDAMADGLTGLGNHRAFQDALAGSVAAFEDRGVPFSLVLIDLDDLKLVNDRDGHVAGDEMLVSLARRMRDYARHEDRLFRTGGDEFAMILPHTDVDDAAGVAQRLLHFCKRPQSSSRPTPFSAGVSAVPRFARQREIVYRQADAALYWAKRNYRGSVQIFDPERDLTADEFTDATATAVAEVITGKLLRPVFQPIVDLRTGHILGFEGLIRPDPSGPLPDTTQLFLAAAAAGRTVDLDLACIDAVVNAAGAIGPDRLLSLNVSPRTLEVNDFDAAWLLSGLARNGISPGRVIVELTEREEVQEPARLQQTINLLQQYGVRLAADDVGAGNSGLRLLAEVQFDLLKVDLALVQRGVHRMGARAVLESVRDLAQSQKAQIIAEGVETSRQLKVVRELSIRAGQGFLLGRPDPSVDKTYVDVDRLESGLVVPHHAQPDAPPPTAATQGPAGASVESETAERTDERRTIILPPGRQVFEAEHGRA
jgi:diguanylate cyclase (GGDEF)-like protein